jgi:hypothetical protein
VARAAIVATVVPAKTVVPEKMGVARAVSATKPPPANKEI